MNGYFATVDKWPVSCVYVVINMLCILIAETSQTFSSQQQQCSTATVTASHDESASTSTSLTPCQVNYISFDNDN